MIKVIQYGLGYIGRETAKLVLEKENMEIVGAVDIAEEKTGKDLGEILDTGKMLGITVSDNPDELFSRVNADVVLHTTNSFLKQVYPQITNVVSAGMNVVSSTEELFFSDFKNAEIAKGLDKLAKVKGVTILGTGVNPGFIMDTLVLSLSGMCRKVEEIRVRRVVDASTRRLPLQRKIGAGLTPDEFKRRVKEQTLGHIGLIESLAFVAHTLGWKLDDIKESINPMMADNELNTKYIKINKGYVAGIKHIVQGIRDRVEAITLDLRMYVGARHPYDSITIKGDPDINMEIKGGIAGDIATVASLVNAIPRVIEAKPGLLTTTDIPISHYF